MAAVATLCVAFAAPAWAANKAPKLVGTLPSAAATEGALFTYGVPAFTDPEGGPITYSASGQPGWLAFDASTRVFRGTPLFAETVAGKYKKYTIKVYATDALGKRGTKSFTLKVSDATPRPLPGTGVPDLKVNEDQAFTMTVPAGAFTLASGAVTYAYSGLPVPEMALFDAGTGTVTYNFGLPQSTVGAHTITVTARDAAGATVSDDFVLTVENVNDAPRSADWHFDIGGLSEHQPFRFTLPPDLFTDEDGDVLSYAATPVGWAAFDPATRTLQGNAPEAPLGFASLNVTATDPAGATGSVQINFTIAPVNDPPFVVAPLADRVLFAGQGLALDPVIQDPEWQPLTFAAQGVPTWASVTNGRMLVGTPGPDDSGTWEVTFTATDPLGASVSDTVLITVIADNHPPSNWRPIFPPNAIVDAAYGFALPPETFTDPDGDPLRYALQVAPAWLQIDATTGALSGTPTTGDAGYVYARIAATDPDGAYATLEARFEVKATADEPATGYTVSGRIRAQPNAAVDSDTNDPLSRYLSNDAPIEAQAVPFKPATIAGFATATATGVAGDRFATRPDEFDSYRFTLRAGDAVTLQISDHLGTLSTANDLDLYLEDPVTLELVAFSAGIGPGEALTVPRDGVFNVVVHAYAGRSNYVLDVGGALPAGVAMYRAIDDHVEFVPGEAIVRYRADDPRRKVGRAPAPTLVSLAGISAAGKPGNPDLGAWRGVPVTDRALREKLETLRAAKQLALDPTVASVDLNYIRRPTATASDPLRAAQWHYDAINLDRAWDVTRGASTVVVAVIDTGVLLSHPDLAANLVAGYDFISSAARARDGDGIDADPDDPGDGALAGQGSFHGTHVAGTVAAVADNAIGGSGVAPGVRVMPLRVLGAGGGTSYDVIQAVRFAAGLSNASGTLPPDPVEVINLSLGGGGYSSAEQETYSAARNAGVIVVAAAGNEATVAPSYPASYEGVVSVSATDLRGGLAPYSNSGTAVDVAAPGGDLGADADGDGRGDGVLSTHAIAALSHRTATYQYLQGTSMATPHVAGVVALMRSIHPSLSPSAFDDELRAGRITDDLGSDGPTTRNDRFGWGLINAAKAVARAQQLVAAPSAPTFVLVDPASFTLGSAISEATVRVDRVGTANARITAAVTSSPELSVVATGVDALGFGAYRVSVDRSTLTPGVHAFTIDFQSDLAVAGRAWVYVEVAAPVAITFDSGLHYVLLVDPITFETAAQHEVVANNSMYLYQLDQVPPGTYYLVVGTDHDNDLSICDPGESCGAYPSLTILQELVVSDHDLVVPDIDTSVQQSIGGNAVSPAVQSRTPTGLLRRPAKP